MNIEASMIVYLVRLLRSSGARELSSRTHFQAKWRRSSRSQRIKVMNRYIHWQTVAPISADVPTVFIPEYICHTKENSRSYGITIMINMGLRADTCIRCAMVSLAAQSPVGEQTFRCWRKFLTVTSIWLKAIAAWLHMDPKCRVISFEGMLPYILACDDECSRVSHRFRPIRIRVSEILRSSYKINNLGKLNTFCSCL